MKIIKKRTPNNLITSSDNNASKPSLKDRIKDSQKIFINALAGLLVVGIITLLVIYSRDSLKNSPSKNYSSLPFFPSDVPTSSPKETAPEPATTPSKPITTLPSNSTTTPESDWKTYDDPTGKYSFKYPPDWYLDASDLVSVKLRDPMLNKLYSESDPSDRDEQFKIFACNLNIAIFNGQGINLDTLIIDYQFMSEAKKITFVGQDAYRGTSRGLARPQIVFIYKDNVFILNYSDMRDDEIVAKVIATFVLK